MKERVICIIPARYDSSRFPGKALHRFNDKPLLQHAHDRAQETGQFDAVFVATDSEKIARATRDFGGRVIITSSSCRSGSDRVAEASAKLKADIIVNIQADEPFLPVSAVSAPLEMMKRNSRILSATTATRIRKKDELYDENVVKVVLDRRGNALYFSRSLIPFPRVYFADDDLAGTRDVYFYKHIGVYLFRKRFMARFLAMKTSYLEHTEKLEQLRILEAGYRMKVAVIAEDSPCVDTLSDIQRLQRHTPH